MRTKTLLLTAALCAAGAASSMAQVYSVNAVGYVNVSLPLASGRPSTFALIANPLNGTNNLLTTILPAPPETTRIYLFRSGAFEIHEFSFGAYDTDTAINPGEGFFIELDNASATDPTVLTFVGEVPQGTLENPLPSGFSIRSSIVPQAGLLTADLGLTPGEGDRTYQFDRATQSYDISEFSFGAWDSQPNVQVAESFWYERAGDATTWSRTFSVN
jgi:hypothetical protein